MAKSFLNNTSVSLGLGNNNPGNIIYDGTQWQGMIGSNGGFVVFSNLDYGIRALGIDLTSKMNEGYDTINLIINRYAPASDPGNDPDAYISYMVQITGFGQDQTLQPTGDTLLKLIRGIIYVENGSSDSALISDADIKEGLQMIPDLLFSAAIGGGIGILVLLLIGFALSERRA